MNKYGYWEERSEGIDLANEIVGFGKLFLAISVPLEVMIDGASMIRNSKGSKLEQHVRKIADINRDGIVTCEEFGLPYYGQINTAVNLGSYSKDKLKEYLSTHK